MGPKVSNAQILEALTEMREQTAGLANEINAIKNHVGLSDTRRNAPQMDAPQASNSRSMRQSTTRIRGAFPTDSQMSNQDTFGNSAGVD